MNYQRIGRRLATSPIRFWSRWISPSLAPRCKYEPSCSRYATQAVEELGILRGAVLAGWRLLRCNPWSHGGVDRVADRGLFREHRPVADSTTAPEAKT
ncbi:MAG: membrane protein insertion efficiency factor YidD [Solirubrobacterales bacterium]|nr:membrane protein insertion efficiency factor YidD [Solirubrobacterales bacterium]